MAPHRIPPRQRLLLTIALVLLAVCLAGVGVFATFTSSASVEQSISSGTVTIALGSTGTANNRLDIGATGLVPSDVGPAVEVGRRIADVDRRDHPEVDRGLPDDVPFGVPGCSGTGRTAVDGVEEEDAVPARTRPGELGRGGSEVGEVHDRDAVETVGVIGETLGEEVVAPAHSNRTIRTKELEQLPIPTRVHQAVVDADGVHPRHPLGRCRIVLRMQDDGAATLLSHAGERGHQGPAVGAVAIGQRPKEIAGHAVREELYAGGQAVEPWLERVLAGRERADFPVRVDVDHGHRSPPFEESALWRG